MKSTVADIETKLAGQFEISGGTQTLKEGAYDSTLPETFGTTAAEQAKGVHAHDHAFIPALTAAAGESAVMAMKAEPGVAVVTTTAKVGNNSITINTHRVAERQVGIPKEGQPVEKANVAGLTTVKIKHKQGAAFKDARTRIEDLAKTHLG